MNPFKYSLDNKRYHTYNYYLKQKYHTKVAKVSLNAGLTCPNRDGTVSKGGCIYCSGDFANDGIEPLQQQFKTVSKIMSLKWPNCKYIAYFQAGSNTYAPVSQLKEYFEPFIHYPDVVGISIATRPDCLQDDVLDYLEDLNKRTDLTIELGLQTIHEKTAKLINRGHDLKCFVDAVKKLRQRNINIACHIINGLPYETIEDMIATAKFVSKLDIQFIKIHMLYILYDTAMYRYYENNHFPLLSRENYIKVVCHQLEYFNEHVVVERLTGDGDAKKLYYPEWSIKKVTILNDIDKYMKENNIWQSKKADIQ